MEVRTCYQCPEIPIHCSDAKREELPDYSCNETISIKMKFVVDDVEFPEHEARKEDVWPIKGYESCVCWVEDERRNFSRAANAIGFSSDAKSNRNPGRYRINSARKFLIKNVSKNEAFFRKKN